MSLDEWQQLGKVLESFAKVIGLFVAGLWGWLLFIKRRQKFPRAKIGNEAQHRALPDERILLRVSVKVENLGEVLLSIESGMVWIQQILPLADDLTRVIVESSTEVRTEPEIEWPLLAEKSVGKNARGEIEPGESETFEFDFILESDIQSVLVYSHFKNEVKREREIGWTCSTLYDIKGVNQE